MGTRGLTCVVKDGEYKVAQYGQWDHYPEGQGATILDFLKNKLNRAMFEAQLDKCAWTTEDDDTRILEELDLPKDGWMDMEQADRFKAAYPQLSRDMGGDVLEFIQNTSDEKILLGNQIEFAMDGLYCEWVYVVDLDNDVLEVYHGYREDDPPEGSRFVGRNDGEEYSAVHLLKKFDINNLPDEETFVKLCSFAAINEDDLSDILSELRDGSVYNKPVVEEMYNFYVDTSEAVDGDMRLAIEALDDDETSNDDLQSLNELADYIENTMEVFLDRLHGN